MHEAESDSDLGQGRDTVKQLFIDNPELAWDYRAFNLKRSSLDLWSLVD